MTLARRTNQKGLLLVEILLAVAIFGMIALIVLSAFVYGRESLAYAGNNAQAGQVANTAVEALNNMAQSSDKPLASYDNGTTYYLDVSGSPWQLTTTPTTINNLYTPTVVLADGPTTGSRQATVTVRWSAGAHKQGTVSATTYLASLQSGSSHTIKTGLLVYANGGTTTSLIDYRLLQSDGFWTSPQSLPSVGANNRVARSVKLYSAQTGKAKMVIARFFDGSYQYIYGFPWTGSSWLTPKLLDSWHSADALDSGNFSGTYLANGTFMTAYSDNSDRPRYNTYAAGSWSAQGSLPAISTDTTDTPTSMVIKARPGTNEVMLGLLSDNYEIMSDYYANGAWDSAGFIVHAINGNSNSTHNVDFDWSQASGGVYGALVYTQGNGQRTPTVRVFKADGSGSGTWGTPMKSVDQPSGSVVISVAVAGQISGSPNFMVCDKDNARSQRIYCYTATPTSLTVPINAVLAPTTAPGGAQTMDLGFEDQNGTTGLAGYSDGSSKAGIKRFNPTTNAWDANPLATPSAAAYIAKTRLIPEPGLNDAMLLQIDSQNNLYSIMYDGTNHAYYTTPTGYAWTIHNANGPSVNAKWFDFGWDN
jgi:type II secretory pathway pseudopilin PulG